MTKWKIRDRIPVFWNVTVWVSGLSKSSEIMKNRVAWNVRRRRRNYLHSDATSRHRTRRSAVAPPWNFGNRKGEVVCIFTDYVTKMRVRIRVNLYTFAPSPQVEKMVSVIFQPLYPGGNSLKCLANWGIGWFSELNVSPVRPLFCHCMFWNESLGNVLTESLLQTIPLLTRIREVPGSVLNRKKNLHEFFLLFLSRYKGGSCILTP
jgi:hypothetical protein